jgi:hypothetical protein
MPAGLVPITTVGASAVGASTACLQDRSLSARPAQHAAGCRNGPYQHCQLAAALLAPALYPCRTGPSGHSISTALWAPAMLAPTAPWRLHACHRCQLYMHAYHISQLPRPVVCSHTFCPSCSLSGLQASMTRTACSQRYRQDRKLPALSALHLHLRQPLAVMITVRPA